MRKTIPACEDLTSLPKAPHYGWRLAGCTSFSDASRTESVYHTFPEVAQGPFVAVHGWNACMAQRLMLMSAILITVLTESATLRRIQSTHQTLIYTHSFMSRAMHVCTSLRYYGRHCHCQCTA